ncbi:probable Uridine nucleosidase [Zygosaccharomyces bailii ISA1307]|nr:probable Uridine nucleosidase [Zygosaccharomyces bailii ISA1307]
MRIPIWLDCDPGHDDTVAILLGCYHPAFEVLGISASYGNASGPNTTYNARSLLTAIGKAQQIPVYSSALKPWIRKPEYAPDIHGKSGLDGTELLPLPVCGLQEESYLDAMERAILNHEGRISIVVTGPLTSLATLLQQKPYLKQKIKFISIMGGGIEVGNRNRNNSGEFNVWIDPEAANFIFKDPDIKDKCILLALDITHKAIATEDVVANVRGVEANCSNLRQLFYELFQYFAHSYKGAQGFDSGPPLHDPLTLIPLLEFYGWAPSSIVNFEYKRLDLEVDEDNLSPDLGRTRPVREYPSNQDKGIIVGINTNMSFFWEQILKALAEAEKCSTIE